VFSRQMKEKEKGMAGITKKRDRYSSVSRKKTLDLLARGWSQSRGEGGRMGITRTKEENEKPRAGGFSLPTVSH